MEDIQLNRNITTSLKVLAIFTGISIISGIVKNEILLSLVDNSMQSIARFTSYLSLFIGNMLMYIVLIIVFAIPWFLLKLLNSQIELKNYCLSATVFFRVLIATEILRFSLLWIFLYDEKNKLICDLSLKEQLANTLWFKLNNIFVLASIVMGAIFFRWSLYRNGKVKFTDSLNASIVILILLVLLSYNF